jgi:hypothetical protein
LARELELFLQSSGTSAKAKAKAKAKLRPLLQMFRDFAPGKSSGTGAGKSSKSSEVFFLCDLEERMVLAEILDGIDGLSFREKYTTCMAPVGPDDEELKEAFTILVSTKAREGAARLDSLSLDADEVSHTPPRTPADVLRLEALHKKAELYLWLSQRDLRAYPDAAEARRVADGCADHISLVLMRRPEEGRRGGREKERDEIGERRRRRRRKGV